MLTSKASTILDPRPRAIAVVLDLVGQSSPTGASPATRVSCGLIHFGGSDAFPTETIAAHAASREKSRSAVTRYQESHKVLTMPRLNNGIRVTATAN